MSEAILERLRRMNRLPSPPGAAVQILQLCQKQDLEISELVDTLVADPALSLRLLKYANSSLLGGSQEVTSVREAVVRLGIRSVRLMALSFSLVSNDDPRACRGFDFNQFWYHSVACAVASRALSRPHKQLQTEEAFAAGLLSHIGKLVFAIGMPDEYANILARAGGTLGATAQLETSVFGASHHELGADLLAQWGIPARLSQAVRSQSSTQAAPADPLVAKLGHLLNAATHAADILCRPKESEQYAVSLEALRVAGGFADNDALDAGLEEIRHEFTDLTSILSLKGPPNRSTTEIQAEAAEILSELTMVEQINAKVIEQENKGLQKKAWTDGLTGIANRAAFDLKLAELWKESESKGSPMALLLLDVDHFKKFNDTHGHQTGDAVLKAVANCLPGQVRSVDFVARYGGEEFVVIMPNADRLTAAQICVKIRKSIELTVVECDGKQHKVTASLGCALLPRTAAPFKPQTLVKTADAQLYLSKGKGRNCCSMIQLSPTPEPAMAEA